MRRITRFVGDWRNGATLVCTALVIVVVLSFVNALQTGHRAEARADRAVAALELEIQRGIESRRASSRRIDLLTDQVGALTEQVVVLREQLVREGVTPAVGTPAVQGSRPSAQATPGAVMRQEPADPPAPTTTTTAPPSPPPSSPPTTQPPAPPAPEPAPQAPIPALQPVCTTPLIGQVVCR